MPRWPAHAGSENKPGFDDALWACLSYDFRDRLPQIGCPTLVVWGEKDAIIPVRDADTFVELIKGARKVTFEDTGHVPMLERPRTFNACLEDSRARGAGGRAGGRAHPGVVTDAAADAPPPARRRFAARARP